MAKWRRDDKCNRTCFAQKYGRCQALAKTPIGDCPFQRTDITMEEQLAHMAISEHRRYVK